MDHGVYSLHSTACPVVFYLLCLADDSRYPFSSIAFYERRAWLGHPFQHVYRGSLSIRHGKCGKRPMGSGKGIKFSHAKKVDENYFATSFTTNDSDAWQLLDYFITRDTPCLNESRFKNLDTRQK